MKKWEREVIEYRPTVGYKTKIQTNIDNQSSITDQLTASLFADNQQPNRSTPAKKIVNTDIRRDLPELPMPNGMTLTERATKLIGTDVIDNLISTLSKANKMIKDIERNLNYNDDFQKYQNLRASEDDYDDIEADEIHTDNIKSIDGDPLFDVYPIIKDAYDEMESYIDRVNDSLFDGEADYNDTSKIRETEEDTLQTFIDRERNGDENLDYHALSDRVQLIEAANTRSKVFEELMEEGQFFLSAQTSLGSDESTSDYPSPDIYYQNEKEKEINNQVIINNTMNTEPDSESHDSDSIESINSLKPKKPKRKHNNRYGTETEDDTSAEEDDYYGAPDEEYEDDSSDESNQYSDDDDNDDESDNEYDDDSDDSFGNDTSDDEDTGAPVFEDVPEPSRQHPTQRQILGNDTENALRQLSTLSLDQTESVETVLEVNHNGIAQQVINAKVNMERLGGQDVRDELDEQLQEAQKHLNEMRAQFGNIQILDNDPIGVRSMKGVILTGLENAENDFEYLMIEHMTNSIQNITQIERLFKLMNIKSSTQGIHNTVNTYKNESSNGDSESDVQRFQAAHKI